ncbi:DUF4817 domain-containing protein [Trichonephila clavipes]|nr:DUF4817 domain-containing protein [Trichonephila clavipes]
MYTNEEYCKRVLLYGQCSRNEREAARLYVIKFPSRRYPSYCTIAHAVQRLHKTGSCHRRIPLSLVPHLQACGNPLRRFQNMPLSIVKVVSGILARLVLTKN